jgi:hypothetical protein
MNFLLSKDFRQPPESTQAQYAHREQFPRQQSFRGINLITHIYVVPRLRMGGAITPFFICLHSVRRNFYSNIAIFSSYALFGGFTINHLNAELNPICHLLILLGHLTFMAGVS